MRKFTVFMVDIFSVSLLGSDNEMIAGFGNV